MGSRQRKNSKLFKIQKVIVNLKIKLNRNFERVPCRTKNISEI